ncbi:hypothetical protein ACOSQ3_016482 [Xanthoceras sorbifolium]
MQKHVIWCIFIGRDFICSGFRINLLYSNSRCLQFRPGHTKSPCNKGVYKTWKMIFFVSPPFRQSQHSAVIREFLYISVLHGFSDSMPNFAEVLMCQSEVIDGRIGGGNESLDFLDEELIFER